MAISLNRVTLIGNVGKDPEVRSTQDGREVASFPLATSESWRDKSSGDKKERTEWHRIVIFSQPLINVIKNYVHKGSKLYIEGALHTRKWNDQNGVERQTTEIVIQSYNGSIMMLDGKGQPYTAQTSGESNSVNREPTHMEDKQSKNNNFEIEHLDDEIPF